MKYEIEVRAVRLCDNDGRLVRVVETPADVGEVKRYEGRGVGRFTIVLLDGRKSVYDGQGKCIREWSIPCWLTGAGYDLSGESADAARVAQRMGFYELAQYVELGRSAGPTQGAAAKLGHALLCMNCSDEAVKAFELLTGRRTGTLNRRKKAWLLWAGFQTEAKQEECASRFVTAYAECMVAAKAEGWQDLKCLVPWISGMQKTRRKGVAALESTLVSDSGSKFELYSSLGAIKALTRPMLRDILHSDDTGNLAEHVLKNRPKAFKLMTPREILLHVCMTCPNDAKSARIVRAVLKKDPDVCRRVDRNGFTPLVYMLLSHRHMTGYERYQFPEPGPRPELEALLIGNGCNPDLKDRFGLSWRELTERQSELMV